MPDRRSVLVVEDDQSVRQVIVDMLELDGFDVREAENGLDALAVLDAWRPDVIVLDLMMPVMDGWAFRAAQLARDDARDIPVVVVSASRRIDETARDLRPTSVVTKPFDIAVLLAAVVAAAG